MVSAPPTTWVPGFLDAFYEAKANEGRGVAGGMSWRASRLGWCPRAQYLESILKQPQPPVDARTARIFQVGHLTARLFAEAFSEAGILLAEELPLSDKVLDLGGHVDFVVGGPIKNDNSPLSRALIEAFGDSSLPTVGVELKSKQSKSFWWAKKKGEPVADVGQRMQAAAYSILAERVHYDVDRWVVLSASKDDLTIAETPVLEEDRQRALDRLALLNYAKEQQDPYALPCVCLTEWGGRMRDYCSYKDDFTDECCQVRA